MVTTTHRLREMRQEQNLTQQYLANVLGVTRQAYCNYENGKRDLSPAVLCKLADFYNKSIDYILCRNNYRQKVY